MDLTIAVPLIMAIVQAVKTAGMSHRWAPLLSIGLGLVGFYFLLPGADTASSLFEGLVAGLTASGLYSGAKTTVTK